MSIDLMAPRYKVINEDTSGNLKKDRILILDDEMGVFWCGKKAFEEDQLKQYPHLFQPLPWYAERGEGEPCDYVKNKAGEVFMFHKMKGDRALISNLCVENHFEWLVCLLPATSAEYEAYIKTVKP